MVILVLIVLSFCLPVLAEEKQATQQTSWDTKVESIINVICNKAGVATEKVGEGINMLAMQYRIYGISVIAACLIGLLIVSIMGTLINKKIKAWMMNSDASRGCHCNDGREIAFAIGIIIQVGASAGFIIGAFSSLSMACMPHVALVKDLAKILK